MRFTRDATAGINLIRGYGGGELRINDTVYRGGVIMSAAALLNEPSVLSFDALLSDEHLGADGSRIMALDPEVVLLGTGSRQIFPPAEFGARFLRKGIGVEVMDTGAACRTYNVLAGEQRRVVAVLLAC
jgi:uncharacterized protein